MKMLEKMFCFKSGQNATILPCGTSHHVRSHLCDQIVMEGTHVTPAQHSRQMHSSECFPIWQGKWSFTWMLCSPAKFSREISKTAARITIGFADAGGPVCTLVTLAVVYIHFTVHTGVSRLTPAVIGCNSVGAVAMDTGVWKALINVEFTACP